MLNGIEFQTVGAAYLKALRPTAIYILKIAIFKPWHISCYQKSDLAQILHSA